MESYFDEIPEPGTDTRKLSAELRKETRSLVSSAKIETKLFSDLVNKNFGHEIVALIYESDYAY